MISMAVVMLLMLGSLVMALVDFCAMRNATDIAERALWFMVGLMLVAGTLALGTLACFEVH